MFSKKIIKIKGVVSMEKIYKNYRTASLKLVMMFLVCVMFGVSASNLDAAPVENIPTRLSQPDGAVIYAYSSGDEFFSRVHDANGFTIIKDPLSDFWCWAVESAIRQGDIESSGFPIHAISAQSLGLVPNITISEELYMEKRAPWDEELNHDRNRTPRSGTITNLVIFIRFKDCPEFTASYNHFEQMHNALGTNVISKRQYFRDVSYWNGIDRGLDIDSHIITATGNSPNERIIVSFQDNTQTLAEYLHDNDLGVHNAVKREGLIIRAINYVIENNLICADLDLDTNGSGAVDHITFIISNAALPTVSLASTGNTLRPRNVFINGKRVERYTFNWETHINRLGVGLLAHEFGHSLGLRDLYNRRLTDPQPIGVWDIMAVPTNPPQSFSAYSKMKIGWIPEIPLISTSGQRTLYPLSVYSDNRAFRINTPNSVRNYFIVEYRRRTSSGIDSTIPGSGLLVYRANSRDTMGGNTVRPFELYLYRPGGTHANETAGNLNHAYFTSSSNPPRTSINSTTNPMPFLTYGELGWLCIADIGPAGATITFNVNIPPVNSSISVFPHTEDFSSNPDFWRNATSTYAEPMIPIYPPEQEWGLEDSWRLGNFANNPFHINGQGACASFRNNLIKWLITPEIILPQNTDNLELSFDVALTGYYTPNPGIAGDNALFAVIVSKDNGATWSLDGSLARWDNQGSSYVLNEFSNYVKRVSLCLQEFSNSIMIAFYVAGIPPHRPAHLHIDNIRIGTAPPLVANIYIHRTGPSIRYFTIQDAVNATVNGDVVIIDADNLSGAYNRNIQWPTNRNISIRGHNQNNRPVIDGGRHPVFIMNNRNSQNVIRDLEIINANPAICLTNSSPSIERVTFRENERGITIDTTTAFVEQVVIYTCDFINNSSSSADGISIRALTQDLIVKNSRFIHNTGDVQGSNRASGASLYFEGNVLKLDDNRFEGNSAHGDGANIMIKRRESNIPAQSSITITNNRFINNRAMGSTNSNLQAHDLSIKYGYRFRDIVLTRNITRKSGTSYSTAFPSIMVYNANHASLQNLTNSFRYINNTSVSYYGLNNNHNTNPTVRDLDIFVGSSHRNFPVDIQNSIFSGGILLHYADNPTGFPNRVRLRNSWFVRAFGDPNTTNRIQGQKPGQSSQSIISNLHEREGLLFGTNPHIAPTNYMPIWNATVKSPLIDAGHPDTNRNGIPWWNDPDDQDSDGTRLDIGAVRAFTHGMIAHSIVPITVNPYQDILIQHTYAWVSFPFIDRLYQGTINVGGRLYEADDLIYNLHHAFENNLFNQNATIYWHNNDGPDSFSYKDFPDNQPACLKLDSRYGYKIQIINEPQGNGLIGTNVPHFIETSGFLYGNYNNPGNGIVLNAKAPGTDYREVWVGYYGESGVRPLAALGTIANHLIEIKTRHWAMSRATIFHPWRTSAGDPRFNRGEAIVLKYAGDIDRTFTWISNNEVPQHYFHTSTTHFIFAEKSDYTPIFVYLPVGMFSEKSGEIGFFINGVCFGAAVILGDEVQINAYINDLDFDIDDAVIKFLIHEYGSRSVSEVSISDFKVYDHVTSTFTARNLDLSNNDMFYVVSFREENEIPEGITYVMGLESNFPNPFNPDTTIEFSLSSGEGSNNSLSSGEGRGEGHVNITIYNIRGQRVKTLVNDHLPAGRHSVVWNGRDDNGRTVSSGIYFYRMTAGEFSETRRMLLMK